MSDYLLDSQMIKEDMLWLKKTNQIAFQELHDQIENMQDPEVKETFDDYCNQINSHEEREALKYRAVAIALAAICIVSAVVVLATKSPLIAVIAAVAVIASTIILGGYLLLNSKLESMQLETIRNPPQRPIG